MMSPLPVESQLSKRGNLTVIEPFYVYQTPDRPTAAAYNGLCCRRRGTGTHSGLIYRLPIASESQTVKILGILINTLHSEENTYPIMGEGGKMSAQQPIISAAESSATSDYASINSGRRADDKHSDKAVPPTAPALASNGNERKESALGDAILRFLRIRKGPKGEKYDLDAV